MMNHTHEFMECHGSVLQFTQQGLEKYNDIMTKDYFRSTSHHMESSLIQILQKQNRLEYLKSKDAERRKRKIKCGNCELEGHNRLTCGNKCSKCGAQSYRDHLDGDKRVPICQHAERLTDPS